MPTDKSQRQLKSLASKHGLVFEKEQSTLAGRKVNIQVLYNGGSLISRLLDGHEIGLAQLGCGGKWAAVLPLEELLALLELESVTDPNGPRSTQTLQQ